MHKILLLFIILCVDAIVIVAISATSHAIVGDLSLTHNLKNENYIAAYRCLKNSGSEDALQLFPTYSTNIPDKTLLTVCRWLSCMDQTGWLNLADENIIQALIFLQRIDLSVSIKKAIPGLTKSVCFSVAWYHPRWPIGPQQAEELKKEYETRLLTCEQLLEFVKKIKEASYVDENVRIFPYDARNNL